MRASLHLARRHALAHPWRTLAIALCIGTALAVPFAASRVMEVYRDGLRSRADATPLVVGPAGSRFDLAFAAMWFRDVDLDAIPASTLDLLEHPDVLRLPIHARSTARTRPLVAVTPEYHEFRGLVAADGRRPVRLGEAVLGAAVARDLGLGPGDTIDSDPLDLYDITLPPTIELEIVGVLAPTGSPDDAAVFTTLETGWLVEGLLHGHDDAETMAEGGDGLVMSSDHEHVAIDPDLVEDRRVRPSQMARFHAHGDLGEAPLTAVILVPSTDKGGTIVSARADAAPLLRAINPTTVFDELLAFAVRIKRLVDGLGLVLGVCTVILVSLVTAITARARAAEFRTLRHVGAPKRVALEVLGAELMMVAFVAAAAAWSIAEIAAPAVGRMLLR